MPDNANGHPPSNAGGNGRDRNGRFAIGNRGGRGNPYLRRAARIKAAVFRVVDPKDVEVMVRVQVAKAKDGDRAAAEFVLDRLIGKPAPSDVVQEIREMREQLEAIRDEYQARN